MSDSELYLLFFPQKYVADKVYEMPDYDQVHLELKRVGVTLKLLWLEYQARVLKNNQIPVQYTKFCTGYSEYVRKNDITSHLHHKPGYRCEVDWSGKTMQYTDRYTKDVIKVYLFVGVLPFSRYCYVEPTFDMKQNTWLQCHINMYEYFGGVPAITVCDNLKTGVISHPRQGDIVLNADYEAMALHYGTVIMPAGVGKPKQKATVENTIGKIATAIIARFRDAAFNSFPELKEAVTKAMNEFNQAPFQKAQGSRYSHFANEKQMLQPLPRFEYEICEWKHHVKVGKNGHVTYRKNYYSCPYQYCAETVSLRITNTTLKIYRDHQLLSSHLLFPTYRTQSYSTNKEDLPERFRQQQFSDEQMKNWARDIGKHTFMVIDQIFNQVKVKEQGYRPALSILNLSRRFENREIEQACKVALSRFSMCRYRHIYAVLNSQTSSLNPSDLKQDRASKTGYVRGADYYKDIK